MCRTQNQLWYNRYKEDREDVNDDVRPGHPSTLTDENIEAVKKMIFHNHLITIGEVADEVGISYGSCQLILTDLLGKKRAAVKIVLKFAKF